jgi:monooxygenase
MAFYAYCKRFPARARDLLVGLVEKQTKGSIAVEPHFTPTYRPWDQRMCLVPNGDLFKAIRAGRVSVVTDQIDAFTETGLALRSGATLDADLIVTATGLVLKFLGGLALEVDGKRVEPAETRLYKGMMCSDVPNLALAAGYTNASWTLKCDLTAEYVCRLLNHMDRHHFTACCPRKSDPTVTEMPLIDFTSGYVRRQIHLFPSQGSAPPWRLYQNYALDMMALRHARLADGSMEFSS